MKVIFLGDDTFFSLLDRAIAHLKKSLAVKEDKWISPEEAMKKIRIKSKPTPNALVPISRTASHHHIPRTSSTCLILSQYFFTN